MKIFYQHLRQITDAEFVDLLKRSLLAERRPIDDPNCINAMLQHSNLLCTAWDGPKLVGVARSITDFAYCCYLSDLAVDLAYSISTDGYRKRFASVDSIKAWRQGENHPVGSSQCRNLLPASWFRGTPVRLDFSCAKRN